MNFAGKQLCSNASGMNGMVFLFIRRNTIMVVPFIALVVVIIGVVWFFAGAARRKSQGKDLGDPTARS